VPGGGTAGQIDGGRGGLRGRGDGRGAAGAGDLEVVRRGVRGRGPGEVDGAGEVRCAGGGGEQRRSVVIARDRRADVDAGAGAVVVHVRIARGGSDGGVVAGAAAGGRGGDRDRRAGTRCERRARAADRQSVHVA